ncbi:hypothetical protein [Pontibacillus marinus]|uniref:Uncharacterized protein n=1 Tax=Pontibacillus marinus BH030004 = DSM 16465 TaxID=1385511 RepID=A0A0A5G6F2_9BACI|nr:hypothetical protein [Pontibacillus marinus]KGX86670.1 hypothetical protein N783_11785 [Pontibacillus marinus BH030004 = DSM 16465]
MKDKQVTKRSRQRKYGNIKKTAPYYYRKKSHPTPAPHRKKVGEVGSETEESRSSGGALKVIAGLFFLSMIIVSILLGALFPNLDPSGNMGLFFTLVFIVFGSFMFIVYKIGRS